MDVLDLFSGSGGFSEGFKKAGFNIAGGVEKGYWEALSFSKNFPNAVVWNEDIRNLHSSTIEKIIGRPDVIIGGPPCEAYTSANANRFKEPYRRLYEDERGRLTLHFIRIVGDLQPEVFVMENVTGIIEGELKEFLKYEFGRVGYNIKIHVFDAERSGTASERRRVFISNVKIKIDTEKPLTVWDVIHDLEKLDERIPNHKPLPLSYKNELKVAELKWGQSLYYFRGAKRTLRNYVKLHPFKTAPTVMGMSRFIHPFEPRLLTPREHARLMGFPDTHIFVGPLTSQYNMAGEAVPPPLSYRIALSVMKHL